MNRREFVRVSVAASAAGVFDLGGAVTTALAADGKTVEVRPRESDELLANPGMGWETFHHFADTDDALKGLPSSTAYFRWYWYEIEPEKDNIDWSVFEETLRNAEECGQKLAFRIMCCGTGGRYHYSPAWLKEDGYAGYEYARGDGPTHWAPDLDDSRVLERHLDLVRTVGQRYDNDPRVAHVDLGSVGLWGEWHMSGTDHDIPSDETCRRIIDTYLDSFQNTPLVMLIGPVNHLKYAAMKGTGWRADCWGDMGGFSSNWCHMKNLYPQHIREAGVAQTWKKAPVALETCWDMRKWHREGWDIDYIFQWALDHHASYLNNKSAPLPESLRPKVEKLLKRIGYRFVLRRAQHAARAKPEDTFAVELEWENVGVAPCYADYVPAISLVNEDGKRILTGLSNQPVRDWLPGKRTEKARFTLPHDLEADTYRCQVAVVDPKTGQPALRLAIKGGTNDGWYPLGKVTVA